MGKELELNIELLKDVETYSDDSWCLVEKNKVTGESIGSHQIPRTDSVFLRSTKLTIARSLEAGFSEFYLKSQIEGLIENGSDDSQRREYYESIYGYLEPREGAKNDTYSMFGTERLITKISLVISPSDADTDAYTYNDMCHVSGGTASSDSEFRTEDFLQVGLSLERSRFKKLCDIIESDRLGAIELRLTNVTGFYSRIHGDSFHRKVKVLCHNPVEEHQFLDYESFEKKPPHLGWVGQFGFNFNVSTYLSEDGTQELDAQDSHDRTNEGLEAVIQKELQQLRKDLVDRADMHLKTLKALNLIGWSIIALLALGLWFK